MTDRMAEPGLQWGPGPHLVGERKDKDEGNGVVGSASRMGKNFEPYPLSLLIVKQLRHYITKRQIGRDCSLFKPDAYAESSSGWPSEPTLLTTTDQPNSLFTMRLSSIIVFAVFSLLTSASAIDGYIDSLWVFLPVVRDLVACLTSAFLNLETSRRHGG
ncbi:hypothetical protein APHAL10511_001553 [Amanita phalloides]|nr:hypothetical protein APHAL10511_001553 [Amanita phalloides]